MRVLVFILLIAAISSAMGCRPEDEIQSYRVLKSRSGLSVEALDRMVVAIADRDDATWFFKVTGQAADVGATESGWRGILASIEFGEDAKPRWTTPAGWDVGPEKPLRFATLLTSNDGRPVELAVSFLGPDQDLVGNVNRWRGQLGLLPITEDELKLSSVQSVSGPLQLFDAEGKLDSSMTAPFAQAPSTTPAPTATQTKPEFAFDQPKAWEVGETNSMVKVRFTKISNGQSAQITVTDMDADSNPWEPNAQRWAREISLTDDPDFLVERTSEITIDGLPAKRLRLISDGEAAQKATVAVRLIRDQSAWFFKLTGDKAIVAEQEAEFDHFLQSFRFTQ